MPIDREKLVINASGPSVTPEKNQVTSTVGIGVVIATALKTTFRRNNSSNFF